MIDKARLFKILKMTQKEVKQYCKKVLKKSGYEPLLADGFIFAEGDLPVVLVAHMDTVFNPPKYIYEQKGILQGKKGLGADDRAGIYAIVDLISKGYRPHILLTEDEEIGCVGAKKFVDYGLHLDAKYIIELDRQGKDDCVFYDCYNDEFTDYIEEFGFKMNLGSYSDISVIAPVYNLGAVNLSVGYYNQHTAYEYLVLDELEDSIKKVCNMLNNLPAEKFEYIDYITKGYNKNTRTYTYYHNGKKKQYEEYYYTSDSSGYGWDYEDDEVPFDIDDTNDGSWFENCGASLFLPLQDCLINLPNHEIIDANYDTDYVIGDDDKVYHCSNGVVKGAVLLSYDFYELSFSDFNGKMTLEQYNKQFEDYESQYDYEKYLLDSRTDCYKGRYYK